jgi:hypothetical protein
MQQPPKSADQIKAEWQEQERRQDVLTKRALVVLVVCLVLMIVSLLLEPNQETGWGGAILTICLLVLIEYVRLLRCPACGEPVRPPRWKRPASLSCPHCGARLRD